MIKRILILFIIINSYTLSQTWHRVTSSPISNGPSPTGIVKGDSAYLPAVNSGPSIRFLVINFLDSVYSASTWVSSSIGTYYRSVYSYKDTIYGSFCSTTGTLSNSTRRRFPDMNVLSSNDGYPFIVSNEEGDKVWAFNKTSAPITIILRSTDNFNFTPIDTVTGNILMSHYSKENREIYFAVIPYYWQNHLPHEGRIINDKLSIYRLHEDSTKVVEISSDITGEGKIFNACNFTTTYDKKVYLLTTSPDSLGRAIWRINKNSIERINETSSILQGPIAGVDLISYKNTLIVSVCDSIPSQNSNNRIHLYNTDSKNITTLPMIGSDNVGVGLQVSSKGQLVVFTRNYGAGIHYSIRRTSNNIRFPYTGTSGHVYIMDLEGYIDPPVLSSISIYDKPYINIYKSSPTTIYWNKTEDIDTVAVYINRDLIDTSVDTFYTFSRETLEEYKRISNSDTLIISVKAFQRNLVDIIENTVPSVSPQYNPYPTGVGTEEDPYVIYTAEQYFELIDTMKVWSVMKLGNNLDFKNIDITEELCIRIHEKAWFDYIDGQYFTIKNFNIIRDSTTIFSEKMSYSMFNSLGFIKNLTIDSCNIILNKPIPGGGIDNTWQNGRQINLVSNRILGTVYGFEYYIKTVENLWIKNSSIYVDLSHLGDQWIHTSVATIFSEKGAFGDPRFNLKRVFVDSMNIYVKLPLIKKDTRITGLVTRCYSIRDSYFNGNITFDIISPPTFEDVTLGVFGIAQYTATTIVNSYSKGKITEINNYCENKVVGIISDYWLFTNVNNSYVDTVNNVLFTGLRDVSEVLLSSFVPVLGHELRRRVINSYSTMKVLLSSTSVFTFSTYYILGKSNFDTTTPDVIMQSYLEGKDVIDKREWISPQDNKIKTSIVSLGADNCYYNTDSTSNTLLHPVSLISLEKKYGRNTSQMKLKDNYKNWNFYKEDGWRFNPNKNEGYPNLWLDSLFVFDYDIIAEDSIVIIMEDLFKERNLKILSIDPSVFIFQGKSVSTKILVESKGIDSIKVFYSINNDGWKYLNKTLINNSNERCTTEVNIDLFSNNHGTLTFKVVEDRDNSAIVNKIPYRFIGVTTVPDKGMCYYGIGGYGEPLDKSNLFWTGWLLDKGCGWVSNITFTVGYTPFSGMRLSGVDRGWNFKKDLELFYKIPHTFYPKVLVWSGKGKDKPLIEETGVKIVKEEIVVGEFSYSNNIYTRKGSFTYKGFRYYVEGKTVFVDDLINGRNSLEYCDFSDLYKAGSIYSIPQFVGKEVIYGGSLGDYHTLSVGAYDEGTEHKISIDIYNDNVNKGDSSYIPLMIVRDMGGFNNGFVIPLMEEPNDMTPLLFDEYEVETDIRSVRNYFRGIHPKIWKYGNKEGIKP